MKRRLSASLTGIVTTVSLIFGTVGFFTAQAATEFTPSPAQVADLATIQGATVSWDEVQAIPRSLIHYGGFLSSADLRTPEAIVRGFLAQHAVLYKLTAPDLSSLVTVSNYVTDHNGVTQFGLKQTDQGRDVYGAVLTVSVDRQGRILIVQGPLYPAAAAVPAPAINAGTAIDIAAHSHGYDQVGTLHLISQETGPSKKAIYANPFAHSINAEPATAELVTYVDPVLGGAAHLAWKTSVDLNPRTWPETLVDAVTGGILADHNQYSDAAPDGTVFTGQHPQDASAPTPTTVSFAGAGFDNNGWVGTNRETAGNNVTAYTDTNADDSSDYQTQTPASPGPNFQRYNYSFSNAYASSPCTDITTDRDFTLTQLFYYVNVIHDYLYPLGFNEAARNFQDDNFGRGGSAGDRVHAEAFDSFDPPTSARNNANFFTPGDGGNGKLQVFLGAPPFPCVESELEGDTVIHEYGHGLSNRLVGSGSLGSGPQTGGMGEGWSDWLATSFYNDPVIFEYSGGTTATATSGFRRVRYDTSPWTYNKVCSGGCEVHNDGEVWATVLWDLRARLINRYGYGPGKGKDDLLVIDGMKNTGSSPTMLNARDGILAADVADNASANQCLIWASFASKGMGQGATTSSDQQTVTESYNSPSSCLPTARAGGPYATNEGTSVALNGATSTDADGGPLTYAWDLDNDGAFDDSTSATPNFGAVGQDGVFTIKLQVTDQDGNKATDTTTVVVNNVSPSLNLATDAPKGEGSVVTVSGSITDPGWLDPLTAVIDWKDGTVTPIAGVLENVQPDATLTFSATHVYGDNANYPVLVCGSDDDSTSCSSIGVQIDNVAPTVNVTNAVNALREGDTAAFSASFSDPGFNDTYTYSIDWGQGSVQARSATVDSEGGPGGPTPDIGHVSGNQVYGDNGTFPITITVTDDDGGVGQSTDQVTVANVDPTAAIDKSSATLVNGSPTFITHIGSPVLFGATSQDPGSDDLLFSWNWDNGPPAPDESMQSLVNAPANDPLPSPSYQPRNVADARSHTFSDACLYNVGLNVGDDDAGSGADGIAVIIQGATGSRVRPQGYWQTNYRGVGTRDFSQQTLQCYLKIAGYMSRVFNEVRDASTIATASDVLWLSGNGGDESQKLDRELLTAWLNFANGGIEYPQLFDTNGDHIPDTAFSSLMTTAESV
ncbi:MAG: M36 family metallopeptidase, partial [Actinobacteria bacterium]|nr:M36 family metallopeptidase [Actinomycetota bacterium]